MLTLFGIVVTCTFIWFVFLREAPDTEQGDYESCAWAILVLGGIFVLSLLADMPDPPHPSKVATAERHLQEECLPCPVIEGIGRVQR